MDCVRASDFPSGLTTGPPLRAFERLRHEAVEFPLAVSPCTWTLPSHASLFTGLYPWEHGTHGKASLVLPPELPTLASMLGEAGYATASFSANALIGPASGLSRAFQSAAWGGWWEGYLRGLPSGHPPGWRVQGVERPELRGRPPAGVWKGLARNSSQFLLQRPWLLEKAGRLVNAVVAPGRAWEPVISSWIEESFERWMREVDGDRPFFGFVNLLEAHEPYLRGPEPSSEGAADDGRIYRHTRQDRLGWVSGRWTPDALQCQVLHSLYRSSIRRVERRVDHILEVLERLGRWENTLVVLTSDHGQAFGEHAALFHMLRLDEPITRIPLWVRWPRAERAGSKPKGWASLIDVVPTALRVAKVPLPTLPSACALDELVEQERPSAVLSMSDGFVVSELHTHVDPERLREQDRVLVSGWTGDWKVVHDASRGGFRCFDLSKDLEEREDRWSVRPPAVVALAPTLEAVGRKLLASARTKVSPGVEERLRAWGYA